MAKVYNAEDVDDFMKSASELAHIAVEQADAAAEENATLKQEIARLKQAAQEKVELEKVAAPHVASLDAGKVDKFIEMLDARGLLGAGQREKYAAACMADSNYALDFCIKAVEFSETPAAQGRGIKSASAELTADEIALKDEDDLWRRVIEDSMR